MILLTPNGWEIMTNTCGHWCAFHGGKRREGITVMHQEPYAFVKCCACTGTNFSSWCEVCHGTL